jgi:hypothetical protein
MNINFGDRYQYRLKRSHIQLLQASLLSGNMAEDAWDKWQSSVNLDFVDNLSHQLLPQLYQNLTEQGLGGRYLPRLRGIYRRTWYANQLAIKLLKEILSSLGEVKVEAIIIGDAANLDKFYGDRCHPISSLQLLVHAEHFEVAIQKLQGLGWVIARSIPNFNQSNQLFIELHDSSERSLTLPLYIQSHLFNHSQAEADRDPQGWKEAKNSWQNGLAWQLSPTDHLLHECDRVFFAKRSLYPVKYPQIISIAEAFLTIRHQSIDWKRLITQAQCYQMITPVRNMLCTLQDLLLLDLPDWVISELSQIPIANSEKSKYPVLKGDRLAFIRSRLSPLVRLLRSIVRKLKISN